MANHDIIVIGASAGGVEALKEIVAGFPNDLPAAVLVVLHVSPHGTSVLPAILSRAGVLPAVHAADGQLLELGKIYVAPPDHHLLVTNGYAALSRGPRENGHRPAVDPLFRTAARRYGARVIGVVLSGVLDDGTAGLLAIKARGGICVCQDPEDAMYRAMPQNAIETVGVDHTAPAATMADLLTRLANLPVETGQAPVSEDMELESDIAEGEPAQPLGVPSGFVCPECGGTLWEIHEQDMIRFRCRVGHAYSPQTLMAHQSDALEEAFWAALRALEERAALATRMASRAVQNNHQHIAARYREEAAEAEQRADLIRSVLLNTTADKEEPDEPNTADDLSQTG